MSVLQVCDQRMLRKDDSALQHIAATEELVDLAADLRFVLVPSLLQPEVVLDFDSNVSDSNFTRLCRSSR